jgi:hypothetical protein
MRVLVGMEYSGRVRDAFIRAGHDAMSCDLLPSEAPGPHYQGDVFDIVDDDWDLAIFHPTCTYLTISAEWAYGDGPYHQKLKPETLTGAARRAARDRAVQQFLRIMALPILRIAAENPIGVLSTRYRKPDQVVQPWWFGDDASKATCLWLKGLRKLIPTRQVAGRQVEHNGRTVLRWGNQTDSGQNRLTPSEDRWKERARTYPGLAEAMSLQWCAVLRPVPTGVYA